MTNPPNTNTVTNPVSGYPDMSIPDAEKNKDGGRNFILAYGQALLSDFRKRAYPIMANTQSRYLNNRAYARGLQAEDLYKPHFKKNIPGFGSHMTKINYRIFTFAPKFFRIILALLDKPVYEINLKAIDPFSKNLRDQTVWKAKMALFFRPFKDEYLRLMGEAPTPSSQFSSMNEIDLWSETEMKLSQEIASEEEIKAVLNFNVWDEIKKSIHTNLIECGAAGAKTYVDANKNIRVKSLIPENSVMSYFNDNRASNAQHFGEIEEMTMADLVEDSNGEISQADLIYICKSIKGRYENYSYLNYNWDFFRFSDFRDCTVKVLDFTFKDIQHFNVVYRSKFGQISTRVIPQEEYKEDKKDLKIETREFAVWKKGRIVLGTNIMYKYGMDTDMIREPSNMIQCRPSFVWYVVNVFQMRNKSLVEDCMPVLDQIHLDWLKIQELKLKLKGKGLSVKVDSLNNVLDSGTGSLKPLQVLEVYSAENILLWKETDPDGKTGRPPIENIGADGMNDIIQLFDSINRQVEFLRQITGVNEIVDASTPKTNQLNGTAEMAQEGTNNALYSLYSAYNYIFKETVKNIGILIQQQAKAGTRRAAYQDGIGESTLMVQAAGSDMSNIEFEYEIDIVDGTQERMELNAMVDAAVKLRDNGASGGIALETGMRIKRIGNTKLAERVLSLERDKVLREDEERAKRLAADKAANDQVSADQAKKARLEEMGIELDVYEKKSMIDIKKELTIIGANHMSSLELAQKEGEIDKEIRGQDHAASETLAMINGKLNLINTSLKDKKLVR